MGTGSYLEIKRPKRGVDLSPLSSVEVEERIELYLYSTLSGFLACSMVKFTYF
jgi:hypothetical protein